MDIRKIFAYFVVNKKCNIKRDYSSSFSLEKDILTVTGVNFSDGVLNIKKTFNFSSINTIIFSDCMFKNVNIINLHCCLVFESCSLVGSKIQDTKEVTFKECLFKDVTTG